MRKKNIMSLIFFLILSFSLIGCNIKDDYILVTKENTDEKLSDDKINEVFESEKMKDLMDKLKTKPKEVSDKADEVDSDTVRIMKELNDKADELTDALNNADLQGKSEDIKNKFDDISDKLDKIQDDVDNAKDRVNTIENPIDKKQVTNTVDEFTTHMDNLERALDRMSSTR
jgi:molecular chaperone GrpE (heat shock protein)